jgi:chemotaxis protein methyltransferase CheR
MTGAASVRRRLEALFAERTGIDLARGLKTPALERLISARSAELGLGSSDAYLAAVAGGDGAELERLINSATVGLTWFFRDPDQLAAVGQLMREHRPGRPLEVWVAGCATGEDAWSLAMIAAANRRDVNVLGTDINSEFLEIARHAEYGGWSRRNLPAECAQYLLPTAPDRFVVAPSLRRRVRFCRHNLMERAPAPSGALGFDLVVCRNVLIYFFPPQAAATVERLARSLAPDGYLVLGPNEMASATSGLLRLLPVAGRWLFTRQSAAATAAWPSSPPPPLRLPPAAAPSSRAPSPVPPGTLVPPPPPAEAIDLAELQRRAHQRHADGQLADALQLYGQLLAYDPLAAEARAFLGIVHYKTGDIAAAAVALRAALFLDPEMWIAAFYLALSYDALGKHAEASREYRRVVSCAGRPLPPSGALAGEIEAWKHEIVRLARQRATRAASPGPRGAH